VIAVGRRAHPFTPGAVTLALIAIALIVPTTLSAAWVFAAAIVIAVSTGLGRGVRLALVAVAPIWVLLLILQVLLGPAPRAAAPWGGTVSVSGTAWALSQGLRLGIIATASLAFTTSFDPHRFLQAAIARRWPFSVAFLLIATLDAADQLGRQARRLREAQRTRGVRVAGSLRGRARALPALIFPLLLGALTEADDRALALETRGLLIDGPRTAIDPPVDTLADHVVRWAAAGCVAAAAAWRILS
jgi:energy-coupling factor transport system permease protein